MLDMMPYPTSFSVIPIMKCLYHLLSQKRSDTVGEIGSGC
jgi:hypothetical protein